MQLKPTLARILVRLGFLHLMDFVLRYSEQARSRFILTKSEPVIVERIVEVEKIVEKIVEVEKPRRLSVVKTQPKTFNRNKRQYVIGDRVSG